MSTFHTNISLEQIYMYLLAKRYRTTLCASCKDGSVDTHYMCILAAKIPRFSQEEETIDRIGMRGELQRITIVFESSNVWFKQHNPLFHYNVWTQYKWRLYDLRQAIKVTISTTKSATQWFWPRTTQWIIHMLKILLIHSLEFAYIYFATFRG